MATLGLTPAGITISSQIHAVPRAPGVVGATGLLH